MQVKRKRKKVGKPPLKIDKQLCLKAETFAAQGLTMSQIANVLGMGESTLYEKQQQYPELLESIKRGKDKGIATITNALFNKAKNGDNTAMIFYLKNRAGWKDRVETEHIGEQIKVDVNIRDKYAELESKLDAIAETKTKSAKGTRKPQDSIPRTIQ